MSIPKEWEFRSLAGQSEISLDQTMLAAFVEDAPAVIFLQRTIEKAMVQAINTRHVVLARDEAVAEILLNFSRRPVEEPAPKSEAHVDTPQGRLFVGTEFVNTRNRLRYRVTGLELDGTIHAVGLIGRPREVITIDLSAWGGGSVWRIEYGRSQPDRNRDIHIANNEPGGTA